MQDAIRPITAHARVEAMRRLSREIETLKRKLADVTDGSATELSPNGAQSLRDAIQQRERKIDALARSFTPNKGE